MQRHATVTTQVRLVAPIRAALYARVSSDQQAERHTIASQVEALLARAAADGYEVAPEPRFLDDGQSGASRGVSALAMLHLLAANTADASEMAGLVRGRIRRKHAALEAALERGMRENQCFLLGMQFRTLGAIDQDLEVLDARIEAQLEPYQTQHRLLMQIPGVDWVTEAAIIAEVGIDMAVFATARRLAAWAGVAPGNYESAGKRKGAGTRRGNVFLKSALFAAASAAARTKSSYYRDKYNRLRARRGPVWALMAIAHKLLMTC